MAGADRGVLEIWFEFASTYSYLSVMRVDDEAERCGVRVAWRPFLLGPIFADQGWNDPPFNLYPAKGRYMWRDLERQARDRGLPFRQPSVLPRNGLLAARVALVASREGWCPEFARAVFRANFADDREIGDASVVRELLAGIGREPEDVLGRALDPANRTALREQTDEARRRGVFGAPSFLAGGELFWGDDRLEQALRMASHGSPLEPARAHAPRSWHRAPLALDRRGSRAQRWSEPDAAAHGCATGRGPEEPAMRVIDADSHFMEPFDWLHQVSPALAAELPIADVLENMGSAVMGEPLASLPEEQRAARRGSSPFSKLAETLRLLDAEGLRRIAHEGPLARRNVYEPGERIAHLDSHRIDVQLVNPTIAAFAWKLCCSRKPERSGAFASAYDTWATQTLSGHTERLIPVTMIDLSGQDAAIAELGRVRAADSRARHLDPSPVAGKSLTHPDYDRLWAACVDLTSGPASAQASKARSVSTRSRVADRRARGAARGAAPRANHSFTSSASVAEPHDFTSRAMLVPRYSAASPVASRYSAQSSVAATVCCHASISASLA